MVIYVMSSTKGLQHTVTVEYKMMTFEYVCTSMKLKEVGRRIFQSTVFLEEILTDLAQNLQRNNCHLLMVTFVKM